MKGGAGLRGVVACGGAMLLRVMGSNSSASSTPEGDLGMYGKGVPHFDGRAPRGSAEDCWMVTGF